ncbi:MAG: hypothetical protein IJ457_10560, partial [Clostridia bacterium]|nr:hypothetical protein [Clostridia bacterium]
MTNPVRKHRACQIKQKLNQKKKEMRDLRVAFWTIKGNFALCPTSFSEVAATQGAAPRPRALLKKVDQNF